MSDQLADSRRFRALTVVDMYTRESLTIEVGQSLKGEDGVRFLKRIQMYRGAPKRLFYDNGSEFPSRVLDLWVKPRCHNRRRCNGTGMMIAGSVMAGIEVRRRMLVRW